MDHGQVTGRRLPWVRDTPAGHSQVTGRRLPWVRDTPVGHGQVTGRRYTGYRGWETRHWVTVRSQDGVRRVTVGEGHASGSQSGDRTQVTMGEGHTSGPLSGYRTTLHGLPWVRDTPVGHCQVTGRR